MTKSELKRLQEVRRTALPKVVERIVMVPMKLSLPGMHYELTGHGASL